MKNNLLFFIFIIFSSSMSLSFGQASGDILSEIDTDIKNPLEMRDPFKREVKKQSAYNRGQRGFSGDTFSNVQQISEIPLDRIRIIGVLLGKERRALAKVISDTGEAMSDGSTYTIREGMTLGLNKGVVKGILPGGIVVVEEITNVYDKKEYLETVIPISNY